MKDFETKNLKIRKFKIEDAKDVYTNLATDKRLRECLGYNIHKNIEETKAMINSYINEYEMNELVWAIEDKTKSQVIGYINAFEVSKQNKFCKFKFGIALDWVNTGFMEEALEEVLKYLFSEEKFKVVVSEFYDGCEKVATIKSHILEKVGMHREAILHNRKINYKTGIAENKIIYSIIIE